MSVELETEKHTQTRRPSKYQIVLLNDDFTTVEFVIEVLKSIFGRTEIDAQRITEQVHKEGRGIAGLYSYEIAKTKLVTLDRYSKQKNFPLKGIMEKVDD